METLTGLDAVLSGEGRPLRGLKIGLLCNQASLARNAAHALDALLARQAEDGFEIRAVFGPQHGVWGHTQDNMVEWSDYVDRRTGLPFYSLYGSHRKPTADSLAGIEALVVDLVDVGARPYTFIWTLALCMEAAVENGLRIIVLDRPNPIGGGEVEGPVLCPQFSSFVGLLPLPMRHGMTIGEIATHFANQHTPGVSLTVVPVSGWRRRQRHEETGLPWTPPSPNMPTPTTALVYPGMCLLEGTTLSEGRGTTRPFEIFGAPGIDGWKLCEALNELELPGARFQPMQFQPTFQKHAGRLCEGALIHVLDRDAFRPVRTAVACLIECRRLFPEAWTWRAPPYKYVFDKLPFDILAGNDWLRSAIERLAPLPDIARRMAQETARFASDRASALLYR